MVTPRFPYPTTKGDKLRAFHALRELSVRHEMTLVAASDEPVSQSDIDAVAPYCKRIEIVPIPRLQSLTNVALYGVFSKAPLQTLFYRSRAMRARLRLVLSQSKFDVIHASLIRVLPYVWDISAPPVVVDLMDSIARGTEIRIPTARPWLKPFYRLEANRLHAYESAACARFPQLFVCAEPDRVAIGAPNISVVRTCADLERFAFVRADREDDLVVMTGNMGYQPNIDAVAWFAANVWPRIRAARPEARFRIVGVRPAALIMALNGRDGITVTGPVPDVAIELQRATVAICPMRGGSGLQTKVLEALATGTPVVSTRFGNEGIGAMPDSEILIADDASAFASSVLSLLTDPSRGDRQASAAHRLSEREFTWSASARRIETIYGAALATQPQAAAPGSEKVQSAASGRP